MKVVIETSLDRSLFSQHTCCDSHPRSPCTTTPSNRCWRTLQYNPAFSTSCTHSLHGLSLKAAIHRLTPHHRCRRQRLKLEYLLRTPRLLEVALDHARARLHARIDLGVNGAVDGGLDVGVTLTSDSPSAHPARKVAGVKAA